MGRYSTSPNIKKNLQSNPYNVHKVPVKNSKIESYCIFSICSIQQKETNSKINSSNKYVKPVKTSCQIKSASIYSITKGKRCRCIFNILAIHKQSSLSNGHSQIKAAKIFLSGIKCMLCCVCSKVRRLQNQSICFRESCPMKRNNSQRRPRHSNLNSRHQCSMHKSPQKSNKKHCLRPNKQHHPLMKTIFYFSCMETKNTFTNNVTPPNTCSISLTNQCCTLKSPCTRILMKKQNQRNSLPLNTESCQCRPRARINKMVPMMRSIPSCCLHTFFLSFGNSEKSCIFCIFIEKSRKQSHFFFSKKYRRILFQNCLFSRCCFLKRKPENTLSVVEEMLWVKIYKTQHFVELR